VGWGGGGGGGGVFGWVVGETAIKSLPLRSRVGRRNEESNQSIISLKLYRLRKGPSCRLREEQGTKKETWQKKVKIARKGTRQVETNL